MHSILRVNPPSSATAPAALPRGVAAPAATGDDFMERLLKMIPGEIIAAYTAGAAVVPSEHSKWLIAWALFCGALLIVIRCQATKDPATKKCQKAAVAFSFVAFVIWLYVIGGPFEAIYGEDFETWPGTLMAIGWTVLVPLVYKGE